MTTIKDDRKLVKRCSRCGCGLPKHHPHHYLCGKCWEEKQIEMGRAGYVDWTNRRRTLQHGKL